ncbi:hypothetical protein [Paenibacillus ihuae]|uniref:hypothetical protein n=1 Tax=Paenibacillus ihuae TaxID=1232431 RepID=UPI0006D5B1DB|nr:hypothetical protein [Paenibacillus ihuae]
MLIQVDYTYKGGTLVVTDLQEVEEGRISAEDDALIAQYIRLLDDMSILGDIEVTFEELILKFNS